MKILYIDTSILGHHQAYIQALAENTNYESIVLIPQKIPGICCKQFIFETINFKSKSFSDYTDCIGKIEQIASEENVNIIHFLDGDTIMRHFGLGFKKLSKKYRIVITFHHFFEGFTRRISYKCMCMSGTAVVHTDVIEKSLCNYGIKDICHIEYPNFSIIKPRTELNDVTTIGMFGSTRKDKGLDILLEALKKVKAPFRLIIAGNERDFFEPEIKKMIDGISDKVTLDLRYLSQTELEQYWDKTDLVVLPYRYTFDGASGQLVDGVSRGLPIIGSSHGSLGKIISDNHLGLTFKTEDSDDLAKKIESIIRNGFSYDETAKKYQDFLNPERFKKEYLALYNRLV